MSTQMRASLHLRRRVRDGYEGLAYTVLSLPVGALCTAVAVALGVGAALSVVWIGLPVLLASLAACVRLADVDRRAANRLLEAHIPPLHRHPFRGDTAWRRSLDALSDRQLWRVVALCAIRLPVALAMLAAGLLPILLTAGLLAVGVQGVGGLGQPRLVGPWSLNAATGVALCLLALPAGVVAIAVLEGLRSAQRSLIRALLAPRSGQVGPVREMLAESLGDRTLSVAYWLPDRGAFVDEEGRPVELPAAGSGRAWTAVDRDGRRVAAILHDAELDTGPELVHAAAAGAALAIDNERLKADLRARVEELRVSRVRIVEAADAARRRLERDLHDGAQQQLVALALGLRLLRARVRDTEAAPLVDELTEKLAVALAELRELARGIHPAILTERGIGPAVEALAERAPVPATCDVAIEQRLSPPIEAAVYFVVAEGLTNVVKYAHATRAQISVARQGDEVLVAVEDDGIGGADVAAGTGLRGLADRLAALDGSLRVHSPPGGGTRLQARIPCEAATLVAEAGQSGTKDPPPPPPAPSPPPPPQARGPVAGHPGRA